MSYIDVTGKTEDEALRKGLEQLGMDRDDVSVSILERAKSGFLGIGATPARIRITYGPDEAEVAAPAETEVKIIPEKPVEEKPAPVKPAAPAKREQPAPRQDKPRAERTDRPQRSDRPRPEKKERPAPVEPDIDLPLCEDDNAKRIVAFVSGLLEHMDSAADVRVYEAEKGRYKVILVGDRMGQLIGHRGETLDAIQQLTNYAVNTGSDKRIRIQMDAENYPGAHERLRAPCDPRRPAGCPRCHHLFCGHRAQPPRGGLLRPRTGPINEKRTAIRRFFFCVMLSCRCGFSTPAPAPVRTSASCSPPPACRSGCPARSTSRRRRWPR